MDRKTLIQLRQQVENREKKEEAIVDKLEAFINGNVGLYVPINGEVNVFDDFKRYKNLYLPICEENTTLNFYKFTGKLYKGIFNTYEPSNKKKIDPLDLDVIIIPLVGFNKTHRIGYGKGYYDRYLKNTQAIKIGIAFDCQEDPSIRKKPNDIDMDLIITETRTIWR
ncbi:MAG: 5-formyltetrahydrofolate cyclo-ligase [Holdemanella sp.]|nr:5-formyltetrahydrofolate cyclo-ligase [Holdemanella sp.]